QLPVVCAGFEGLRDRRTTVGGVHVREPIRPAHTRLRVDSHAQKNVAAAGAPYRRGDGIDIRNNLTRERNLNRRAGLHEAVLQVDDEVRGAPQVRPFERMELSALRADLSQQFRRQADLVHAPLPRSWAVSPLNYSRTVPREPAG